jgi:hypothetical protein
MNVEKGAQVSRKTMSHKSQKFKEKCVSVKKGHHTHKNVENLEPLDTKIHCLNEQELIYWYLTSYVVAFESLEVFY